MLDLLMVGAGLFGTWGSSPLSSGGSFWADVKPTDYAIAVFTLFLVVFTGLLWRVNRHRLRWDKDTTHRLQRAYLSVEPLGIVTLPSGSDARTLAHIGIRNTGHLPARDVQWIAHIEAPCNGERQTFDMMDGEVTGPYLVPSGTTAKFGTVRLPEDKIDAKFGGQYCFVWGVVIYNDGFEKTRFTEFCHRYPIGARLFDGTIEEKFARYHNHGNDAD